MPPLEDLCRSQLLVFLCVLARVGGLIIAAPVFGARSASPWLRLALAAAVALLIAPVFWHQGLAPPADTTSLLPALCREGAFGLLLGFALLVVMTGLHIAGRLIGQMSGIALAEVIDADTGARAPLFGRMFGLLAVAVFLLTGGHRQVLGALLDTFQWMPPGTAESSASLFETCHQVVAQSFVLAVRASAPIVVALLSATLIVGFVSRAVPQLNSIVAGFSVNAILAVAMLSVSLGGVAWLYREHALAATEAISAEWRPGALSTPPRSGPGRRPIARESRNP